MEPARAVAVKLTSLRDELERFSGNTARRMIALLDDAGPEATDRKHFGPGHFTASAFVLSPDGRSLLLIHHAKLRRWLQPGGHIDGTDDSPFVAARRELREETGLVDATGDGRLFDLDIHPIPANPRQERAGP